MGKPSRANGNRGAADRPRGLLGRLRRITANDEEIEAEQLREDAGRAGATPIASCGERQRVCVVGTLRAVTLKPRGGAPALEAELYDGSDVIDLVWLGRRRIRGIEPGRIVRAEGLVTVHDEGRRVIFNPRYELRSATE